MDKIEEFKKKQNIKNMKMSYKSNGFSNNNGFDCCETYP